MSETSPEFIRRAAIIEGHRAGRSATEIIRFFGYPKSTVYDVLSKYTDKDKYGECSNTPARKPHSKKCSSRTSEAIKRTQALISEDPGQSLRKMEDIASGRPYVFQQDGAPAHTSHLVQNWLSDNMNMFWSKEFCPPNSPDLNPLDYYV